MIRGTGPGAGRAVALIWLIGLPIFLAIGRWYDGIIFLVGLASMVQGVIEGQILRGLQIACWSFGFVVLVWRQDLDLALLIFAAAGLLLLIAAVRSLASKAQVASKLTRDELLE